MFNVLTRTSYTRSRMETERNENFSELPPGSSNSNIGIIKLFHGANEGRKSNLHRFILFHFLFLSMLLLLLLLLHIFH